MSAVLADALLSNVHLCVFMCAMVGWWLGVHMNMLRWRVARPKGHRGSSDVLQSGKFLKAAVKTPEHLCHGSKSNKIALETN